MRCVMEVSPKAEHEPVNPKHRKPKIRSRRHPVKVMCLGAAADPQEEHGFDGRICMKRASNQATASRRSTNQRFSDNMHVNTEMISGGWRELVTGEMKVEEAMDVISQTCNLGEHVSQRLKMNCTSCNRNGGKRNKDFQQQRCPW